MPYKYNPFTNRLDFYEAGSPGTVTSFSFTDANGFAGVVTNATSAANLTLTTSVGNFQPIYANAGALVGAGVGTATQVLTSNGAGMAPSFQNPAAGVITTTYTSGSGTWTINANTKYVELFLWGPGGPGGSGYKGVDGVSSGGGGGGGGQVIFVEGPAAIFTGSISYTVGVGGVGGTSITTNNTVGNPGVVAASTVFGPYAALGGNTGAGGTLTTASGGTGRPHQMNFISSTGLNTGGIGQVGSGSGSTGRGSGSNPIFSPGAGGGGGGGTTGARTGGTAGGYTNNDGTVIVSATAGGIAGGGAGGNGTTTPVNGLFYGGFGGGGGGGAGNTPGQNGGVGGTGSAPGGGGGGGGGAINDIGNSGAGGNGGAGRIMIIEYT